MPMTTKQARRNPLLRDAIARVDSCKPPLLSGGEIFEFFVSGLPITQGDLAGSFENGRLRLRNPPELRQWRKRVAGKASQAMGLRGPIAAYTPVLLGCEFLLPRQGPMANLPMPVFKNDEDKLQRAVRDALTGILYADDGQIAGAAIQTPEGLVALPSFKRWAQNGEQPGVIIRIRLYPLADTKDQP